MDAMPPARASQSPPAPSTCGPGPDNWFAAQLKPNALRIALRNLDRQGFAAFAPRMTVVRRQPGRVTRRAEPVFPGYVFVQFDQTRPGWRAVNGTQGITRLVTGDARAPRPLPRDFMAALLDRCDAGGLFAPAPVLDIGDRVEMIDGPLAALVGRIVGLDRDGRVRVMMEILGGQTPVIAQAQDLRRAG